MTDTKSVKVLKKEEVEKGNHGTVVELPYVPIVDEEAEANTQEVTVKLPNNTKVTITKIAHRPQCQQGVVPRPVNCSQESFSEGLGIVRRGCGA